MEKKTDNRPVTERVKTFEDACKELGINAEQIQKKWKDAGLTEVDEVAYQKLRIITLALNEGWKPQFTEDEIRYTPWLVLYTKEEVENASEEEKEAYNLQLWLAGGDSNSVANCGLAYAHSNYAWSNSYADYSARLAYKTRELARYSGLQFTDLWANYTTGKEVKSWRNS